MKLKNGIMMLLVGIAIIGLGTSVMAACGGYASVDCREDNCDVQKQYKSDNPAWFCSSVTSYKYWGVWWHYDGKNCEKDSTKRAYSCPMTCCVYPKGSEKCAYGGPVPPTSTGYVPAGWNCDEVKFQCIGNSIQSGIASVKNCNGNNCGCSYNGLCGCQ